MSPHNRGVLEVVGHPVENLRRKRLHVSVGIDLVFLGAELSNVNSLSKISGAS